MTQGPEDEDLVDDIEEISESAEDDDLDEREDEAEEQVDAAENEAWLHQVYARMTPGHDLQLQEVGALDRDDFYKTITGEDLLRIFGG